LIRSSVTVMNKKGW